MNKQIKSIKEGMIESAILLWLLFNAIAYTFVFIIPKIKEIISR